MWQGTVSQEVLAPNRKPMNCFPFWGTYAAPFGGFAVGRTSGNSIKRANMRIDRKGFRHIRRLPSADSLNQSASNLQSLADANSRGTALTEVARRTMMGW